MTAALDTIFDFPRARVWRVLWVSLLLAPIAPATPSIMSTGGWSLTIDEGDLGGSAGSDFIDTHTSEANIAQLDISGTSGAWTVTVQRDPVRWPAEVRLWVRRTSDGTPSGSISGGDTFQEITSEPLPLFQGQGDVSGIALQYRVTGVSVTIGAGLFDAPISYTLSDGS